MPTYSTLLNLNRGSILSTYITPSILISFVLSSTSILSSLTSPSLPRILTPSILRLLTTHVIPSIKYLSSSSHLTVYDFKASLAGIEKTRNGVAWREGVYGCILLVHSRCGR